MGEQLVVGIDAYSILQLAAHLGGDLQHEAALRLVRGHPIPFEAVMASVARHDLLPLASDQQLDHDVRGSHAVQMNTQLDLHALAERYVLARRVQTAHAHSGPAAPDVRLPERELARVLVATFSVAPALAR